MVNLDDNKVNSNLKSLILAEKHDDALEIIGFLHLTKANGEELKIKLD